VRLSEWVRDEGLELPYDRTVSNNPIGGYHHMGTTRMAADPRRGVVDGNCRVHGYRNLYIAGSSTFTTAGWANPTFTIVALALRLGEHLERELEPTRQG
jgi:choline dehydrogenase-like flavoprotein